MNIQQYYRYAANSSLNGSLVAFIPVFVILIGSMVFSIKLPLLLVIFPFCLYSFFCYQQFVIQHQRSVKCAGVNINTTTEKSTLESTENILITFMPAPSLRMLLFNPEGVLIGEVKDAKFWWWRWFLPYFVDRLFPNEYHLNDQKNQLLASYRMNKRKKLVQIFDCEKKAIGLYSIYSEPSFSWKTMGSIESYLKNRHMTVESSKLSPNLKVRDEHHHLISKLIKGWMPLEWGKHFQDANTPFIVFDSEMDEKDKLLIIATLVDLFQYTKH